VYGGRRLEQVKALTGNPKTNTNTYIYIERERERERERESIEACNYVNYFYARGVEKENEKNV
jgi:hypothetical protein